MIKKNIKIITEHWDGDRLQNIDEYLSTGGYGALKKVVEKMNSDSVFQEIKKSRLLGRGGAGFPIADKLAAVMGEKNETKYLVCNLDESEPGTYKDREIVEHDPFLLLEGMTILALVIGAKKAFIYINGNYQKLTEILKKALGKAKSENFLGEKILNSDYSLEIEIFSGAGAYICGEETALINSLEGKRGEPKIRPPFPTQKGLWGAPTLVNNAETISNIPWIILNGGEKYSQIGTEKSSGTKLFSLGGAVKKLGIYEAPMGITLKKLIEMGGGIIEGKEFWFAQLGGASGRLLLEKDLDVKLEFDREAPFPLGSGAVLIADKTVSIHEMLLSWTDFFRRESCGKCVPCREGTFRLWEIAKRLQDGEIFEADKSAIQDILWTLENTCFCPLGKFSACAFRDAWENFKKELCE